MPEKYRFYKVTERQQDKQKGKIFNHIKQAVTEQIERGSYAEKIKELNAFAEKNCNKCELRAACYLAKADWHQAKRDYPCFWATDGLVLDITSRYHNEKAEIKQRIINRLLNVVFVESMMVTALTIFLLFVR